MDVMFFVLPGCRLHRVMPGDFRFCLPRRGDRWDNGYCVRDGDDDDTSESENEDSDRVDDISEDGESQLNGNRHHTDDVDGNLEDDIDDTSTRVATTSPGIFVARFWLWGPTALAERLGDRLGARLER